MRLIPFLILYLICPVQLLSLLAYHFYESIVLINLNFLKTHVSTIFYGLHQVFKYLSLIIKAPILIAGAVMEHGGG